MRIHDSLRWAQTELAKGNRTPEEQRVLADFLGNCIQHLTDDVAVLDESDTLACAGCRKPVVPTLQYEEGWENSYQLEECDDCGNACHAACLVFDPGFPGEAGKGAQVCPPCAERAAKLLHDDDDPRCPCEEHGGKAA